MKIHRHPFLSFRLTLAKWLIGKHGFGVNLYFNGQVQLSGGYPTVLINCHSHPIVPAAKEPSHDQ